ncbi:hypothetical protein PHLGIDRAFT_382407 [Phlebiopsis gigantea 11061_1 CR5-6]|uniref:Uncharacterized protein n=1 Tax=Phlebiopsis gigantea (strain 11061_1 CR5-6) TaxID=745531 RepID=A0A0C3S9I8_PHLG1|nr:hypothetical protein PHLGIDRAFT_382407 [Phlebiopsis gigantea 11061_1 CR5-6]
MAATVSTGAPLRQNSLWRAQSWGTSQPVCRLPFVGTFTSALPKWRIARGLESTISRGADIRVRGVTHGALHGHRLQHDLGLLAVYGSPEVKKNRKPVGDPHGLLQVLVPPIPALLDVHADDQDAGWREPERACLVRTFRGALDRVDVPLAGVLCVGARVPVDVCEKRPGPGADGAWSVFFQETLQQQLGCIYVVGDQYSYAGPVERANHQTSSLSVQRDSHLRASSSLSSGSPRTTPIRSCFASFLRTCARCSCTALTTSVWDIG